jgi:hypothetical protein
MQNYGIRFKTHIKTQKHESRRFVKHESRRFKARLFRIWG